MQRKQDLEMNMLRRVLNEKLKGPGDNDVKLVICQKLMDMSLPVIGPDRLLPDVGTKAYANLTDFLEKKSLTSLLDETEYIDSVDYCLARAGLNLVDHRCCRYCVKCGIYLGSRSRLHRLEHYSKCRGSMPDDIEMSEEEISCLNTTELPSPWNPEEWAHEQDCDSYQDFSDEEDYE